MLHRIVSTVVYAFKLRRQHAGSGRFQARKCQNINETISMRNVISLSSYLYTDLALRTRLEVDRFCSCLLLATNAGFASTSKLATLHNFIGPDVTL